MLVFLFLVIISNIIILFNPKLFIHDNLSHFFENYKCEAAKSFYHNPDLKIYHCHHG